MRTWLHRSSLVALAVAAILSFSIAAPAGTIPSATSAHVVEQAGYAYDQGSVRGVSDKELPGSEASHPTIPSLVLIAKSVAAESAGNLATTSLSKTVTGVADDALVHFSPETYTVVKPGAGGELFTFRYGDIKHLTPRQLETVIGPMSTGGQTGGASVMHVLESGLGGATKTPGAVVAEIPEYIFSTPSRAAGTVIVQ